MSITDIVLQMAECTMEQKQRKELDRKTKCMTK